MLHCIVSGGVSFHPWIPTCGTSGHELGEGSVIDHWIILNDHSGDHPSLHLPKFISAAGLRYVRTKEKLHR